MNSYLNTKSSIRHRSATSSNEDDDDNESTTTDVRKKSHRVQSTSREAKNKSNKDDNDGDTLTHRRQQQRRRRRHQDNNNDDDDHVDKKMKNCTKLFIANIHPSVTNEKLEDLFDKYGKTVECEKIADKGYAFVHYEKAEQAHKAVKMLNEYEIAGQKLYVGLSTNGKPPRINTSVKTSGTYKTSLRSKLVARARERLQQTRPTRTTANDNDDDNRVRRRRLLATKRRGSVGGDLADELIGDRASTRPVHRYRDTVAHSVYSSQDKRRHHRSRSRSRRRLSPIQSLPPQSHSARYSQRNSDYKATNHYYDSHDLAHELVNGRPVLSNNRMSYYDSRHRPYQVPNGTDYRRGYMDNHQHHMVDQYQRFPSPPPAPPRSSAYYRTSSHSFGHTTTPNYYPNVSSHRDTLIQSRYAPSYEHRHHDPPKHTDYDRHSSSSRYASSHMRR